MNEQRPVGPPPPELGHLLDPRPPSPGPATSFDGSCFDVGFVADSSIESALDAARRLGQQRGIAPRPLELGEGQALTAFSSSLTVDGHPPGLWADLSGYYRDRNGRPIQLHCNFAHHASGVAEALGVEESRSEFEQAIAQRDAFDLEAELIERGLVGAAERSRDEWDDHPHARATADLPLVDVSCLGAADARPTPLPPPLQDDRPGVTGEAAGLRVLDFSRVLAGPVAGQMLAGLGADVLRVGAEKLPSVAGPVMLTGAGKRNAFLDLDIDEERSTAIDLASTAHVVIDAYRPGALARHGLGPEDLAVAAPGVVIVQISAFDWVGPWAGRRGYDSIVQTTTGISHQNATAAGLDSPLPLPVQALDYATGYLAAAAALILVAHQQAHGGSWLARLSLLRTRNWLNGLGGRSPFTPAPVPVSSDWLAEADTEFGRLRSPVVPGTIGTSPAQPLGSSPAVWLDDLSRG